jgi:hypothetical protein
LLTIAALQQHPSLFASTSLTFLSLIPFVLDMAVANQLMRPFVPRQPQQFGGSQQQQVQPQNQYHNPGMQNGQAPQFAPDRKKVQFWQREVHDCRDQSRTASAFHEDDTCVFLCIAVSNGDRLDEKLRLQRVRPAFLRIGEDLAEGSRRKSLMPTRHVAYNIQR